MSNFNGAKKVLVVEDDVAIADLLATVIESEGYHTVPAYDGEAAVRLARHECPDLITLDLALPKKDGRDVLRALQTDEITSCIPVIVVSAYTNRLQPEDRRHVVFVVNKPFDIDDLLSKLRAAMQDSKGSKRD
ncbi:MAG: response regulator [Chloroflexi bacterium]|nr:response regulator [Chloroflexota bacterium]MCL5107878.1 response regulator [Chloroflexota bacterium]